MSTERPSALCGLTSLKLVDHTAQPCKSPSASGVLQDPVDRGGHRQPQFAVVPPCQLEEGSHVIWAGVRHASDKYYRAAVNRPCLYFLIS